MCCVLLVCLRLCYMQIVNVASPAVLVADRNAPTSRRKRPASEGFRVVGWQGLWFPGFLTRTKFLALLSRDNRKIMRFVSRKPTNTTLRVCICHWWFFCPVPVRATMYQVANFMGKKLCAAFLKSYEFSDVSIEMHNSV